MSSLEQDFQDFQDFQPGAGFSRLGGFVAVVFFCSARACRCVAPKVLQLP